MITRGSYPVKKIFPAFLVAAVCTLVGCCVHNNVRHPGERPGIVEELKSDTVALVHKDDDGDWAVWCTGVWVDKDKILTADHCARAPVEALVSELNPGEDDDDKVDEMVQGLEDGFQIQYFDADESTGVWREPKAVHVAKVLKHDKAHDLALLQIDAKTAPAHHVAPLADKTPAVGDNVHVMGHVTGLTWTYTRGIVGAYREENFRVTKKKGPFLQFVGEAFRGNSGGGGFNDNGELVGIASFLAPAPNEVFFIHLETIRSFLGRPVPR